MEDIIDIDIDKIIKDTINNEEYEEKLNKEKTNYINNFNQNLEKNINDILAKKGELIQKGIDLKLSNYSNLSLQIEKERNNFELNFKNDLVNLKKEASNYFKNLKVFFKKQKGEEHKIDIKFENKKIEKILDIKYAKFINIDNIIITNIGQEVYKNLIFARDNDNSSDNIYFFNNYSNPEIQKLTMPGDFEHDDSEKFNISLKINDPKPNQTYKMIIYVREQNLDEELSEPLEIIIKINPEEDPIQLRKKQANHIYEEIKKEFHNYKNLIDEDEIINQLLDNNLNKDEIKKNLISKIKQRIPEKKLNDEERVQQLFKELKFYNMDLIKEEIIAKYKKIIFKKKLYKIKLMKK